jgi:hypothetical protein
MLAEGKFAMGDLRVGPYMPFPFDSSFTLGAATGM